MGAAIPLDLQRAELEQVLQSGLFARAPRLERFLRYICERHFEDRSGQVKEYSIALEALGRPPDFDPKRDSIVRVEAHRLRKRLAEYYAGPGSHHPLQICIPNGQYRPQFVPKQDERPVPVASLGSSFAPLEVVGVAQPAAPPPIAPTFKTRRFRWLSLLLIAVGALPLSFFLFPRGKHRAAAAASQQPPIEVWHGSQPGTGASGELRLLAGYHGSPLADREGRRWLPDAYYEGGLSAPLPPDQLPTHQADTQFLRAQRSGAFDYAIPLRDCTYELHLYFFETEYGPGNPRGGDASSRTFRLFINGRLELDGLDPLADAGAPDRLYERVLKDVTPDRDGKLHLAFRGITGPPFLNAIRILPSPPGRIHPVRIVAQENSITDSDGRLWAADEYFLGGNAVFRRKLVRNGQEGLYQGERYGNFSYRIPLAPGKYRLKLHFAETWFGTPESGDPATGSRLFDLFVNGVALLRNYDIARDANGPNRGIEKVFENLQPNAQGLLLLEFVPVRNYAEINAIEIVEIG